MLSVVSCGCEEEPSGRHLSDFEIELDKLTWRVQGDELSAHQTAAELDEFKRRWPDKWGIEAKGRCIGLEMDVVNRFIAEERWPGAAERYRGYEHLLSVKSRAERQWFALVAAVAGDGELLKNNLPRQDGPVRQALLLMCRGEYQAVLDTLPPQPEGTPILVLMLRSFAQERLGDVTAAWHEFLVPVVGLTRRADGDVPEAWGAYGAMRGFRLAREAGDVEGALVFAETFVKVAGESGEFARAVAEAKEFLQTHSQSGTPGT